MLPSSYKVMHYFLGFPPYRTGGLTKLAVDLMETQAGQRKVVGLWPGEMRLFDKKTKIRLNKRINGIYSAELVNPLPVSLDEGVISPKEFMLSGDIGEYEYVLGKIKPDIIHIHTLMGLHEEFMLAARRQGIPIVFTTHDYYGICTKVYMFDGQESCDVGRDCSQCAGCNIGGLSVNKIMLLQSPLYRWVKNSPVVKQMRKKHRAGYFDDSSNLIEPVMDMGAVESYRELREFYRRMLGYVDYFHFTSTVAEGIYREFVPNIKGEVINITHRDIHDNRRVKSASDDHIRLTYLAPAKHYKGYNLLKRALDELYEEGDRRFSLNVYGAASASSPYMKLHSGGYTYDMLGDIFSDTDVLLAPSLWYETFGYTVLEAISYGVPVIISDRVGAKDIVGNGGAVIDVGLLKQTLRSLNAETINNWNEGIMSGPSVKEWKQFADEIDGLYAKVKR